MNHIPETELALYAGGDLEPGEHLRDCAECRARLEEFEAAREWLKELAVEPSVVQVQNIERAVLRVVGEAEKKSANRSLTLPAPFSNRRPGNSIRWMGVAAAAVVAVLLVFGGIRYFSPAPPPVPAPAIAMVELPDLLHVPIELKLPRTVHRPHREPATMTVVSENNGNPVVRLKTSDPNVIVLWVLNTPPKEGNIHE